MYRRYLVTALLIVGAIAAVGGTRLSGASQETPTPATDDGDLSTRVAALETRVAVLESIVGTTTGGETGSATASATATGEVPAGSGTSVEVVMQDIKFDPTEIAIPANTDVTINLVNAGATVHTFDIDALNIHSGDVAPGATMAITVNAAAGDYQYFCSVPGHKEAGMVGTLHVGEGGGGASGGQAPSPTVNLEDIRFDPTSLTIPANIPVTVTLVNKGAAAHTFDIDALNVHSGEVQPGTTTTVTVNAAPGQYQYYCAIPGHKAAGMVGTLTVVEGSGASGSQSQATPSAQAGAPPGSAFTVGMEDIKFEPKDVSIPADTDVVITVVNNGVTAHNFNIDALNVHSGDVPPGQSVTLTINAPPGQYQFYCAVPGHKEAGMVGTLRVGNDGASTSGPTGTAAAAEAEVSLSGSGPTVTDPIEFSGGLYKLAPTCDQGILNLELQPVTGGERVSVLLIGVGSTDIRVERGQYILSIQCQGAWTLVFTPVV